MLRRASKAALRSFTVSRWRRQLSKVAALAITPSPCSGARTIKEAACAAKSGGVNLPRALSIIRKRLDDGGERSVERGLFLAE